MNNLDDEVLKIKVDGEEFVHIGDLNRMTSKLYWTLYYKNKWRHIYWGMVIGVALLEVPKFIWSFWL